jgi:hypothetical protein
MSCSALQSPQKLPRIRPDRGIAGDVVVMMEGRSVGENGNSGHRGRRCGVLI